MDEVSPAADSRQNWVVQVDPRWQPSDPMETPPTEMILGGWMLNGDIAGLFEPNPGYLPPDDSSPCDPVDAALRRAVGKEGAGADIVSALRHSIVDVGCDQDDHPLIGLSPDGVPCIVVATAEVYKRGVEVDRWYSVPGRVLPQLLPDDVDIMLNPEGPAPLRLCANALVGK